MSRWLHYGWISWTSCDGVFMLELCLLPAKYLIKYDVSENKNYPFKINWANCNRQNDFLLVQYSAACNNTSVHFWCDTTPYWCWTFISVGDLWYQILLVSANAWEQYLTILIMICDSNLDRFLFHFNDCSLKICVIKFWSGF